MPLGDIVTPGDGGPRRGARSRDGHDAGRCGRERHRVLRGAPRPRPSASADRLCRRYRRRAVAHRRGRRGDPHRRRDGRPARGAFRRRAAAGAVLPLRNHGCGDHRVRPRALDRRAGAEGGEPGGLRPAPGAGPQSSAPSPACPRSGRLFLANRLLPLDLAERAGWEVRAFFTAWILAALVASLYPKAKAWPFALGIAALAFLAIPIADAITVGQARFLGFDAAMLAVAILLAVGARLAPSGLSGRGSPADPVQGGGSVTASRARPEPLPQLLELRRPGAQPRPAPPRRIPGPRAAGAHPEPAGSRMVRLAVAFAAAVACSGWNFGRCSGSAA